MSLDCKAAWSQCLSIIEESINPQSFTTWFKPISPVKLENQNLIVEVPSQFFYEWLEGHYSGLIKQALLQVVGENAKLTYSVGLNGNGEHMQLPSLDKKKPINRPNIKSNLNERYLFDNFVEGPNNQFARAAALAVSEAPGNTTFNPIVIYGGVGLGKTHLIQAIGNFTIAQGTAEEVLYVDSEKFTIEFINSIKNHRTTEFSSTYRNVDVLLVDDIQFFSNKERTQEEFFHTFNALYNSGKQIVLSSDRPPKELVSVEERLISRFQWGLVADIQPPDLETRIAILQQKADENGINIPGEIIEFIATNITSNIRELEGALIRLLAFSSLNGKDITLSLAKDVLKNLSLGKSKKILIEEIQRIVSEHYNIPDDMLRAKTRKKEIAYVRQIAMYLAKELTKNSLKTIGLHFGGRDHTTVIHAIQTVENQIKEDSTIREEVAVLRKKIEMSSM
ncbi:chromosomal replication initiator protein DnaA [candidate division KSB1 bacterium]|nr:chromosomal replication initiator protein DnaA [candidate division KSB1 bacterium]NIR72472.1 chromosomal replication initiator protein DnaA [candidate division KSB1 bacterium]NIS24057.1 chromosomal replication initiator protein DnaA [candidate division KSB1 bacterium]NIT70976.1 chromosomal replication initiator protein DnaA [candidate division KSB1 bacterium]NIU27387.1 chromosomal replication initiator protein DnaA [candidate division KSB1 bacterium]